MIHELRVYRAMPGRLAKLVERFEDHTTPIWDRLGITHVGFWTTLVGDSESNDLTYLLAWDDLSERETKWAAFQADEQWHRVKAETEREGPLHSNIHHQLLTPTSFSRLK